MRHRREQGAVSLEQVGLLLVAGMLVAALVVVLTQRSPVGEHVRVAVCNILSAGQGSCGSVGGADGASRPEPTQPCTVSGTSGNAHAQISVSVVTMENGRQFQIEQLSDGTYRMTVGKSEGAGLAVGVGAGGSLTIADRTVGAEAVAGAGAGLTLSEGQAYHAEDADELRDLVEAHMADVAKDELVAESGPVRWVTDQLTDGTGLTQALPEPDAQFHEGGFSVNASANAAGLGRAHAGVSAAQALGYREAADGSRTFYMSTEVTGEAGLMGLGVDTDGLDFKGGDISGTMEMVTAVTVGPDGEMTSVDSTVMASGEGQGLASAAFTGEFDGVDVDTSAGRSIVFESSLPMDTAENRAAGMSFLANQGIHAFGGLVIDPDSAAADLNYFHRAREHGTVTAQGYDLDGSTPYAASGSGKAGPVALGGAVDVSTETIDLTDARYWDGSQMSDWTGCTGASAAGGG